MEIKTVKGEIHNVLAVLRLSLDDSLSSGDDFTSSLSKGSVFSGLYDLYDQLRFHSSLEDVNLVSLLTPFISAITSPYVSTEVTHTALISVHKFLLYGLVRPRSQGVSVAMRNLSQGTMDVQFLDRSGDMTEIIYLKVLEVLLECVRSPAGHLLSNDVICAMLQASYEIRTNTNSSPLLSGYAENILIQLNLLVFSRLRELAPYSTESIDQSGDKAYGVPALVRILKFLAKIINPDEKENDKETREFGLRMMNIALETSGTHFSNHTLLLKVVQDDICKQVLQNSQTSYPSILSLTLRIVFNLFHSVKEHLKVQLEVFFTSIHLRLIESSTSYHQKHLVLESLVEFCHEPALIVGLFRNYDCDVAFTNLFQDLFEFLSNQALPFSSDKMKKNQKFEITNLNTLALEAILAVLESISKRFGESSNEYIDDGESSISEKKRMERNMQLWNKEGPVALKSILGEGFTPEHVADFFHTTSGLDRRLVGAYLGMPIEFNVQVLEVYIENFSFEGKRIDDAMRVFLESFVIPGESQIIERIMECFSKKFFRVNREGDVCSEDAAFILAYSIIMLNTDAHNPNVKVRMDMKSWIKNNKGCNDGNNFSDVFLRNIYHSIISNPIAILSEKVEDILEYDQDGNVSVSSFGWKRLISKSKEVGVFKTEAAHEFGKEMFSLIWMRSIHILNFYMERSSNPKVLQRIIEGYYSFSNICSIYGFESNFNNLAISLCNSLIEQLEEIATFESKEDPIVLFGRNAHVQRLVSLLFNIILGQNVNEVVLQDAWPNIIQCLLWLFTLRLLPASLTYMDDFRDPESGNLYSTLRSDAGNSTFRTESMDNERVRRGSVSFISSMFSIWSQEYDSDDSDSSSSGQHSTDDLRMLALESIRSCQIEQMFFNCRNFPEISLFKMMDCLMVVSIFAMGYMQSHVSMDSFPRVLLNEETAVFCIERLSDIVENNHDRLDGYWKTLYSHFTFILNINPLTPSFFLERIIVNMMRLCVHLAQTQNIVLVQYLELLEMLNSLPQDILVLFGPRIMAGTLYMVKADSKFLTTIDGWEYVFNSVKRFSSIETSSQTALDVMQVVIHNHVSAENFLECFKVLSIMVRASKTSHAANRVLDVGLELYITIGILVSRKKRHNNEKHQKGLLKELWLRSLQEFCKLFEGDKRVEVRLHIVDCLQRALLSSGVSIKSPSLWEIAFGDVLIPSLTGTSERDQVQLDDKDKCDLLEELEPEVRVKVSNLLFQTLLHNIDVFVKINDFTVFWVRFMGALERFMVLNSVDEPGNLLQMHFSESLKNGLNVMENSGIIEQIKERTGQDLNVLSMRFSRAWSE